MPTTPTCQIVRLGLIDYLRAWEVQTELARQVHEGSQPNSILLLEHPPIYTMGQRGRREEVLLTDQQLSQMGISLHEADRGGQVTYHGPGQLVAYPIIDLRNWGGPVKYVRTLEQVIIRTLADFGIGAGLIDGLTGVWIGSDKPGSHQSRKIAAIGVKISRGVCYHGLAINVSVDLSPFDHIIPCGIENKGVTSMEQILGCSVDIDLVAYSLVYHFGREMGLRMVESDGIAEELTVGLSHTAIT